MKAFDYLAVLLSIVLGLGLTQLLLGFARWLELRDRVRPHLPSLAWAAFLLVADIQTWWSMFGLRHWEDWSFLQFVVVLVQPILLFLLAALALPSANSPEPDLKANFFANRTWFFGLLLGLLGVSILKDIVRSGTLPGPENLAFHVLLAATGLAGLVTRREGAHRLIALAALAVILTYVGLLFPTLA